ncbi:tripartite tricarboxylate transporter substrate binding protein [Dankookia rubra]|uniref:Tripartite tricarboxylate transporter substrate binding protein n=1 Tax=Dankookia rubra TaxID=1442381 RepID=A0A4R5QGB3_9PROT|nr:tripartite tricarboxylate transporter substrate binding protein [Dankookia rubra]TDH61517.1 tripartite tricarboxylate transporter substrate binding protein [Dankookia rubra]
MRRRTALLLSLLPVLLPGQASAQATSPLSRFGGPAIRLVVPFAPGGGADTAAHILAPSLAAALGRPVLVENRPGGRGIPGADLVARANPDGQTLGLTNTAPLGMAPLLEALPYDPDRDFTHVALIAETPSVLLVPADSRFQTFDLYLRAARSWARGLTYGSPATGSLQHLQGEMLAKAAGARLTHVAYRGTGPALLDLLNGQVDSMMAPLASAIGAVTSGRARALAVSGPAAEPSLPGVPAFAALGFPQLTATAWMGLSGPRGLPPTLVERLNGEVNRIIALPEVAAQLRAAGLTPPDRPLDAAAYRQLVADFATTWRPVVAASGMSAK